MTAIIAQSTVAEFFADPASAQLLSEYAAESALSGLPEPVPNRALYDIIERCGNCVLLTARLDGELIGFLALLVSMNPHYSQVLGAAESFFVAKQHRGTGAGLKLLRQAERVVRERDGVALLISAPLGGKLAEVLSASRSFDETNRVFCKVLR